MMNVLWVVIERPSPAEEPQNVGATNDEGYAEAIVVALRSVSRDGATYWKEAIDYIQI